MLITRRHLLFALVTTPLAATFGQAADDATNFLQASVLEILGTRPEAQDNRRLQISLFNEDYQFQISNIKLKVIVVRNPDGSEVDGPSRVLWLTNVAVPPRGRKVHNVSVNFGNRGQREPDEVSLRVEVLSAKFYLVRS